jgi:hypothetical protein
MRIGFRRQTTMIGLVSILLLSNGAAWAAPLLEFGPVGRWIAGGAAVGVPLTLTCGPADLAAAAEPTVDSVFVAVRQAVGDVTASGTGFIEAPLCDGTLRSMEVPVAADPGSRPFRPGHAFAQVSLTTCPGLVPGQVVAGIPTASARLASGLTTRSANRLVPSAAGPAVGDGEQCSTISTTAQIFILPSVEA